MAAVDYANVVQQLYVSYFGRPADYYGLQNFEAQLNAIGAPTTIAGVTAAVQAGTNVALVKLVNSFNAAPESVALYGAGTTQIEISKFVAAIYTNVLGRPADVAGANWWIAEIVAGRLTKANAALAISAGALVNTTPQGVIDAATITAKVAVANDFTTSVDTIAEINAYSGDAAAAAARAMLATVTNTTTVAAFHATVDATIAGVASGATAGQTFTLTDKVDNIVGTAGNDTINAYVNGTGGSTDSTLTAADVVNGGTGTDTLNVTTIGTVANVFNGALVSGVEAVSIRNTSATTAGTASVSATGLTSVVATGTGDITVTNLANGVAFSANGATGAPVISQGYVATATNAVTNLSGAALGTVTLVGAGIVDATINTTGTASTTGAIDLLASKTITINAAANLTAASIATTAAASTLTVKGTAASVNVGILDADLTTVDASGLTVGGLTATVGAVGQKITGGAGNDNITTLAAGTLMTAIVDAGTGTDTLTINGAALVDSVLKGAQFTGFETLAVNSGVAAASQDVANLSAKNTFTSAVINQSTTDATGIVNMNAAMAAAVTLKAAAGTGAITFGIKDATVNGNIDTLKIIADDGVAITKAAYVLTAPVMNGVENLEVTSNELSLTINALTSATGLTSAKFAGSANYDVTTGIVPFALNTVFDFTAATGTVSFSAAAATVNGLNIKGSLTGANTILDSVSSDVITGGAKQDTVTLKGGADIVKLGAGADLVTLTAFGPTNTGAGVTFKFVAGDSVTVTGTGAIDTAATGVTDKISGVDGAAFLTTAGTKFIIDNGVLSSASATVTFGANTAPTMGTTAVAAANAWFVNVVSATSAFVYQDTNGNAKIDAGEFAVELVGTNLTNSDFTIVSGNLTFIGAA